MNKDIKNQFVGNEGGRGQSSEELQDIRGPKQRGKLIKDLFDISLDSSALQTNPERDFIVKMEVVNGFKKSILFQGYLCH